MITYKIILILILFLPGYLFSGIQSQDPKCCKDYSKKEEKTPTPNKKNIPPKELKPNSKMSPPTIQGISEQVLKEDKFQGRLENLRSIIKKNSSLEELEVGHEKLRSLNPLKIIRE